MAEYYVLATYSVKPSKLKEFQDYNEFNHDLPGTEYVATFTTTVGREGVNTLENLYKVLCVDEFYKGRQNQYFDEKTDGFCTKLEYTFMDKLPYSVIEDFMDKDLPEYGGQNAYVWAEIEVRGNRTNDYHDYWSHTGIKLHHETGADHVVTFNMISGQGGTTRVKRLFKVFDYQAWVDGEVAIHNHGNRWYDLAVQVWTTAMYAAPYSRLK